MNKTIDPFLSALKLLKDTFIASSKEADEIVREAEIVCRTSSYASEAWRIIYVTSFYVI